MELTKIHEEVNGQLANKEVLNTLVLTTFKGLKPESIKQAVVEGMMRGFEFKDFLEKNIYAIPFGQGYSLVTSIDHARKIGMRSGVIGKSEPVYEMSADGKKIVACSVTIKRKIGNEIGDFTAKVYFDEYTTGRNQWTTRPRTMIAKVAEMHALRMACPEEMAQSYVEEEMEKTIVPKVIDPVDIEILGKKLQACTTLIDLQREWSALPFEAKQKLEAIKNEVKSKLN